MSVQSTGLSDHERGEGARSKGAPESEDPDRMRPVTPKEAAKALGCNLKTVYAGIKAGQIPVIRVGKLFLIPRPAFDRLLRGEA